MSTNGAASTAEANGELSAAQRFMQKHVEPHSVIVEDVPDEEDIIKHGEAPRSSSILEGPDDVVDIPVIASTSKAAEKQPEQQKKENKPRLDIQSQDAFPELGAGSKGPSTAAVWSAKRPIIVNGAAGVAQSSGGSASTSGAATPTSSSFGFAGPGNFAIPGRHSERIVLAPNELLTRAQMKKPLPDILKDINKRSKANVAMSNGANGLYNFTAVGPQDACRQALKDVVDQIGAKQSVTIPIPRSVRAHIIGKGGSTIKNLQEKTGARIQMPKDDGSAPADDDDDDALINVVVEGNSLGAGMAKREIEKIVNERTATAQQKLKNIPAEFYPFIAGPNNEGVSRLEDGKNLRIHVPTYHTWRGQPLQQAAPGQQLNFRPPPPNQHITLSGDRQAVLDARANIERRAEELRRQLALEQLGINRGRHQFIVGDRGIPIQQFLADTGCAIILPDDSDDETITIIGPADRLQDGVDRAVDLASSMNSTNLDISRQHRNAPGGAAAHARNVTRYLQRRKEIERLERLYNTHIVTPKPRDEYAPWELYSREGKNAIRAQSEITGIVNGVPPSRMTGVNVDPFFHQHLSRDVVPKLHENYGVYTVLPDDNDADAPVLLVFEGPAGTQPDYQVPRSQPSPEEVQAFQKSLEEAKNFLLEIINGQEAIKAQSIDVPLNFHEKLRRFIKREQESRTEKQIPVRVTASGTVVTLRGTASAVDALAEKVNAFIAQEIEDEKERGFKLSFDFPQKHANQLIGKQGSNIKELRDRFDVEIQVDDGKVTLTGPKAKAEVAKSHIEKLGKQWADETTHNLKVEPKYHRELIGASGNQINKLQTRYKVQIHFPRSAAKQAVDDQSVDGTASEAAGPKGGRRAQQPEDIVIVRGPSRGADEARDEILSLLQYLKDTSFSATVTVQQSQIPSLIGQGGKALDELREQTGARIDIPGSREAKSDNGLVEIQIKGTKAQVAAAKKAIEERKSVFEDTVVKTIEIEKKHHRALIGQGGSTLRDIILKAGGSDDRRELARTVQFPKTEEDGNKIKIEGRSSVVDGIIKAMEDIVSQRDAQTTEVVEVPASQHRNLIGRGGDTKNALQRKFNVAIDVPHKDSGKTGIKIVGLPADVEAAKEHILELTKEEPGVEILVPRHLHNLTSNNGQIFRQLRNDHGVTVDHKGHKIPAKSSVPKNARSNGALPLITDDATDDELHSFQTVTLTPGENDEAIPWVLRGSDAEKLKKAQATVENALSQAQKTDTIGYLVLPDPRLYRYVIGQGGAKLNGIRKQTGCKIDVPRQGESRDAIEIYGSSEGVDRARDLILEAVQEGAEKNQNHRRS